MQNLIKSGHYAYLKDPSVFITKLHFGLEDPWLNLKIVSQMFLALKKMLSAGNFINFLGACLKKVIRNSLLPNLECSAINGRE